MHPDSGENLPTLFRMSGFLYFNVPTLFLMVCLSPTPLNTFMSHWLNQSYNAGLNYANRNASCKYTSTDMAKGYVGACVTSIGLALGL